MARKTKPKRETIANVAYRRTKEMLLSGEYLPGQFLQVEDVSRDLGLGRTPVHQALHLLGQEGLLEIIPRKGILVRAESLGEVRQSLEVRMLMEPHCAAACAENATPQLIARLLDCMRRQRALAPSPDKADLMPLDREFHTLIASNAHNPLIVSILQPIHERMTRTWLMPHWRDSDFMTTIDEHAAIVDAIERKQPEAAAEAMRAHLLSVRQRMGLR